MNWSCNPSINEQLIFFYEDVKEESLTGKEMTLWIGFY
jgi:hypothetical protein